MALSKEQVRHVANLARLKVDDDGVALFQEQLNQILEVVDRLQAVDTEGVRPTAHVLELKNVLREDRPEPGLTNAEALANAPDRQEGYFKVPKIVGSEEETA